MEEGIRQGDSDCTDRRYDWKGQGRGRRRRRRITSKTGCEEEVDEKLDDDREGQAAREREERRGAVKEEDAEDTLKHRSS